MPRYVDGEFSNAIITTALEDLINKDVVGRKMSHVQTKQVRK